MPDINFDPFPQIKTERLLLRKITDADAEDIFKLRSDKNVMKYIGKKPVVSIGEARDWAKLIQDSLQNNSGITWGISMAEKESLIGTIGFWRIIKEHYRAEIGYMLLPQYWKQGFTKEAILKVIDYGFQEMKLHSIEAHINPKNIGSATVLEKTGFVLEAYFKEDFFFDGAFEDTAIYSLLA